MTDKIVTPEFRVSFPNVFQPSKAAENAEPKYGVAMLFPKDADLKKLKALCKEAVREKWGDNPPKNLRTPFRDQGEKEFEGYEEGALFCSATSKQRPGLVDANLQPILDSTDFYPGCYARATVRAFAYDVSGNRGVGIGLQNLQKTREGDPLGGRTKPEDDFEPVSGGGSDFDPAGSDESDGDAASMFD